MPQLKTPGVYTKETPTLAPSVAEVSTAIPVFIGYTENAVERDIDGLPQLVSISSLMDYRDKLGGAYLDPSYTVKVKGFDILDIQTPKTTFQVAPALEFFFKNGGSNCYVISLGTYADTIIKTEFESALTSLEKTDVPTLICMTDAVNLHPDDYHDLLQQSLLQCAGMDNRFCILDVLNQDADGNELGIDDASAIFREGVGNNNLMYGAAYYPNVRTTLTHAFDDTSVKVLGYDDDVAQYITDPNGIAFYYKGDEGDTAQVEVVVSVDPLVTEASFAVSGTTLTLTLANGATGISPAEALKLWNATAVQGDFSLAIMGDSSFIIVPLALQTMNYHEGRHIVDANGIGVFYYGLESDMPKFSITYGNATNEFVFTPQPAPGQPTLMEVKLKGTTMTIKSLMTAWGKVADKNLFDIKGVGDKTVDPVATTVDTALSFASSEVKLGDIKFDKGALYNDIISELRLKRMTMPPSAGIAGIYANIDNTFGVWQAPANTGISSVIEPTRVLNSREQENLNVDVNAGKSINVIRNFTGKGNLVWGARTMAGNDNEWRYINVRRLFNMVKASLQKATGFAVFQPNTPITWLKVRAMMESYLEDLWQAGGLVGDTKEQAFFVRIGLGQTMNEDDILNGRMKIDVGLRASRPAEFIVINFTHHVQES